MATPSCKRDWGMSSLFWGATRPHWKMGTVLPSGKGRRDWGGNQRHSEFVWRNWMLRSSLVGQKASLHLAGLVDVRLTLGFRIRKSPWPPTETVSSSITVITTKVIYLSPPMKNGLVFSCFCPLSSPSLHPLVSLIFLNRSLVFPILLFSSISLHWSLRKAFLYLLTILWNSAFTCLYLVEEGFFVACQLSSCYTQA